ncbi:DUF441 domain-containing protein [Comamonas endophytica]|uniref:DUF441 domain-containing protein n=1 Tax=Comamonas endophytica TaxID=2949090 RepID=UPI00360C4944
MAASQAQAAKDAKILLLLTDLPRRLRRSRHVPSRPHHSRLAGPGRGQHVCRQPYRGGCHGGADSHSRHALALYFPWLQKHGLNIGIFLLMVAVMVPIASGKIPAMDLLKSFTHWKSAVAIVVGIFVAWLGGRGVTLMAAQPGVVAGLMVGTILGVAFFRGVPVGPLIAAGVVSLLIGRS